MHNIYLICFYLLTLILCSPTLARAEEPVLRIQKLIPEGWVEYPSIEPALPSNYVLGTESIYAMWGEEKDIEIFKNDQSNITSELIVLRYSCDVFQTGPNSFSVEDQLEQILDDLQASNVKSQKLHWGQYPVFAIEALRPDGSPMHFAWVGLNSQNGLTLFMNLFVPKTGNQACPVWKNFLNSTTQLQEPDFFRALGYDMHEGCTTYTLATASVKATLEKRVSDNLVAIKIEPLSPNTSYSVKNTTEGYMGTKWRYGAPCVKLYGKMVQVGGKYGTLTVDSVITVLTKHVENFSFDLDQAKHPEGTVIFTNHSPTPKSE